MRELLLNIKRGQHQYFDKIVNGYLPQVYFSALKNNSIEEAQEKVVNIFFELFKKINKYLFVFNAQNYVEKNLSKICKKQGIELSNSNILHEEIPGVILRMILLRISRANSKKKKTYYVVFIPVLLVFLSGMVAYVHQLTSNDIAFPHESINSLGFNYENVYSEDFTVRHGPYNHNFSKILDINKLGDKYVMVSTYDDLDKGNYSYYLYDGKERISSFKSDNRYEFLTIINENFISALCANSVYYIDLEGNIIDVEEMGMGRKISSNRRYIYYVDESKSKVFDTHLFNEIGSFDKRIYYVSNDGSIIFLEDIENVWLNENALDDNNIVVSKIYGEKLYLVLNSGIIYVYDIEGNKEKYTLGHFNDDRYNLRSDNTYIDVTEEYIIVAFSGESESGFEIISKDTGECIIDVRDTLKNGEIKPTPSLSFDEKYYTVYNQSWVYNAQMRFNLILDLDSDIISAYVLPNDNLVYNAVMVMNGEKGYLYMHVYYGEFVIFEVSK
jgi:hypothetical protein